MPVLLTESANSPKGNKAPVELPLFDENGEPTLAGHVIADFLESADFSEAFDHPAAAPFVITVVDEDDETIEEQVLPGSVVLRVIDEGDLHSMFLHYLDILGENALAEDASLDDKSKLALFENLLLKPLNERFKRGAFRQMRKAEGGARGRNSQVNMMLGAMIAKGEIKRAKKTGGGYKGGDYEKGGKYKSGATNAAKAKGKAIARRMKSKNVRAKATASRKRAARRGRSLAASVGMEESFLFGHGQEYGGAIFQVGVLPEAEIEMSEADFGKLKTRFAPAYESMKPTKGRTGFTYSDEAVGDGQGNAGETNESIQRLDAAPFAGAAGTATLSESAAIAGRVGLAMGFGRKPEKPLNEAAK